MTPSGRTRFAFTCCMTEPIVPIFACVSPEAIAMAAGPPPLYGTWIIFVSVITLSSAIVRCTKLPLPDEP